MKLPILILLGLVGGRSLSAQGVFFVDGPSSADLSMKLFDERSPDAPPLVLREAVEFLAIEITNRLPEVDLRVDRPRLRQDAGLHWVELPNSNRLFSYRLRGGEVYGLLQVAPGGVHRFLLELPGAGFSGLGSPFTDRFGVAPDGRHAAATTIDGRVFLIRLDGGLYTSTGTAWREITSGELVMPFSLTPSAESLFYATEDQRVWRLPFGDETLPEDVTPPAPVDPDLKDQFTLSGDGRRMVFLYGEKQRYELFLIESTGPAVALSPPPAKYEEPGYLPEDLKGPRMLLNADGSRLMYTDSSSRDEIYLLDISGQSSSVHVTGDENFEPYIGIGILPIFIADLLTIGIGEPDAFDVFRATTGIPLVENLSQSPGNQSLPFHEGRNRFEQLATPGSGGILAQTDEPAGGQLLRLESGQASAVILDQLQGPLRRGIGLDSVPDYQVSAAAGDVILSGKDGTSLFRGPAGVNLSPPVSGPGNSFTLFLAGVQDLAAVVLRLPDGFVLPLLLEPGLRGFNLTRTNALLLISEDRLEHLSGSGRRLLSPAGTVNWVLSGLGSGN
ncbi:MAG: TolB-like translocation protein [Planctomycetota bacterium]|jgi:hypothetical protein